MNKFLQFIKDNPARVKAATVGVPLLLLTFHRISYRWPIFEVDPGFAIFTLSVLTIISVMLNRSYIKNILLLMCGFVFGAFINSYLLQPDEANLEAIILGILCGLVAIFIFSYIPDLAKEYSKKPISSAQS